MFRNSSKTLLEQIMSRKFLEALEDVLTSPRTPMIVKERLMEVLGAVTYACGNGKSQLSILVCRFAYSFADAECNLSSCPDIYDSRTATSSFCELWRRLKSPDDPEEVVTSFKFVKSA